MDEKTSADPKTEQGGEEPKADTYSEIPVGVRLRQSDPEPTDRTQDPKSDQGGTIKSDTYGEPGA